MSEPVLIAAVEGGGTSFVVAVVEIEISTENSNDKSNSNNNEQNRDTRILHRAEIDSSHDDPKRTLEECASFFRKHKKISKDGYRALGVAMFGPLGCNPESKEEYGTILPSTPKKSWRGVDVLTPLIQACESSPFGRKLAVKIDTDVNAPAVAEYLSEKSKEGRQQQQREQEKEQSIAKSKSISSLAYVTIGTGVGVGLVIHGQPVHGRMHPEGGHVPVQPLEGDTFTGYSWGTNSKNPFRGKHTVESMTSSVALTERLEQLLQLREEDSSAQQQHLDRACLADLEDDNHEVWEHAANALANLCVTLALVMSVEKIVLGGGVMKRNGLIEKIRRQTRFLLNGYLGDLTDTDLAEWITSSSYGSDVGLMGAMVLAQQAIAENNEDGSNSDKRDSVEKEVTAFPIKKLKQAAYNAGLWHGFALGLSAAYIGICLWTRSGKSSGHRR